MGRGRKIEGEDTGRGDNWNIRASDFFVRVTVEDLWCFNISLKCDDFR